METYWVIEAHVLGYSMRDHSQGIVSRLFDVEGLPQAKISHDVENEGINLFTQVNRCGPFRSATILLQHKLIPTIDMLYNETCSGPERLFSKGEVEQLAFPGVLGDVNGGESRILAAISFESSVEVASLHVRLHPVYVSVRFWVAEENRVGFRTDRGSIDLELLP